MADPRADRPYMPGYGILPAGAGRGLLPWSWAVERLLASRAFWLATTWPDGRPHVMPVWGVWRHDRLWFSTSSRARKARNLLRDPRCVVTTDDPSDPVVIEGTGAPVDDLAAIADFAGWLNAKHGTAYPPGFYHPPANVVVRVRPSWAFGVSGNDFAGSPTRWTFEPPGPPRGRSSG